MNFLTITIADNELLVLEKWRKKRIEDIEKLIEKNEDESIKCSYMQLIEKIKKYDSEVLVQWFLDISISNEKEKNESEEENATDDLSR